MRGKIDGKIFTGFHLIKDRSRLKEFIIMNSSNHEIYVFQTSHETFSLFQITVAERFYHCQK